MKKILNLIFVFILFLGLFSFGNVKKTEACSPGDLNCCYGNDNTYNFGWGPCDEDVVPPTGSLRCTCSGAYSACGTYLGQTDIRYRTCTQSSTGTTTCTKVGGTFYDVVSCAAGVPTATPIQTIFRCDCTATLSGCENYLGRLNSQHRDCSLNATSGAFNCQKVGSRYIEFKPCGSTVPTNTPGAGATSTPIPGNPTNTPVPPSNCSYRFFCMKTTGKCESTNKSYYDTTAGGVTLNGQCGGGPTCEQNLPNYHQSLTGGKCFAGQTPQAAKAACQATCKIECPKLAEGDADCDGAVTYKDYFYYVSKKANASIREAINVDFNTDGKVNNKDRDIVVKTLKP